jgi:hypothetical protein
MGLFKYVVRSAWREAGLMARLLYLVGIGIPTGLSTIAVRTDIPFLGGLANLLPWWGWLVIASFVATTGLLVAISKRARRLDDEKMPTIICNAIRIWNNAGEYFVRVQLENVSATDVRGAKPYLIDIQADDPLRQIEKIDFALPLYTQARLRERFMTGPINCPVRPIDFSPRQPKWVEIFQITEAISRQIHLVDYEGRQDIETMPKMKFKCSVYGISVPVDFSVLYEEDADGWRVSLVSDHENVIDSSIPAIRDE